LALQVKAMASLHFKLLGGFAAFHPSGHAIRIHSKKNRALLAYLAVNAAKPLTRES
jgi:DNA-binding SARP family transcriptional activator